MLAESLETAILTYHSVATRRKAGSNAFKPVYLPSIKFNDSGKGFSGDSNIFPSLTDRALILPGHVQLPQLEVRPFS
jgi:nuclear pore complex protein Nup205